MHKLPGLTSYDNIVLERGMSPNDDFKKWREDIVRIAESGNLGPDGLPTPDFRRNVIVELYDKGGVKVKEWEVFEAWPAVLEIGDLDAESSDVLIETLELANEGHRQTM
jgi:phage tail-like protein